MTASTEPRTGTGARRARARGAAWLGAAVLLAAAAAAEDTNRMNTAPLKSTAFEAIGDAQFLGFLRGDDRAAMCKVPESVTALDHVPIGETKDGFALKADLFFKTRKPVAPRPAIIFLHDWAGGKNPLRAGDTMGSYLALCHDLVFVSLFYRPPGEGYRAPCALEDVRTCARWLRSRADEYAIQTNGIVAMGRSAGTLWAFLAAAANGSRQYDESCGYRDHSGDINLVVLVASMIDVMERPDWDIVRTIIGATFEEAPDAYRRASRLEQVRPGLPPTFMVQGEKDNLPSVLTLRDRLRAAGNDVAVAVWPGAGHGNAPFLGTCRLVADFVYSRLQSGAEWP